MVEIAPLMTADGREIAWQPLPKQFIAMQCPTFELLYGGSKGGAKTNYLVGCVIPLLAKAQEKWERTGIKQRKCRIMVFRKNLDDLKDFIVKSHEIYPVFDRAADLHTNSKTWTFDSGATVECHHLDGPEDHKGFNGNELTALLFDEVQQISYEAYSFLLMQVRTSDPEYRPFLMIRATANPGGYDWVAQHFGVNEYPDGGKILESEVTLADGRKRVTTRTFIRAWLRDNPYLNDDGMYEANIRANMSADEIAMYLDGDFQRAPHAFFSNHIRADVHFVQSQPIPGDWEMRFAIDWGSAAPASLHVGAIDREGCLWVIDELHCPGDQGEIYGEKMQALWKAQAWSPQKKWRTDDFYGLIDKQALDRHNGPATAGAGIAKCGFRIFEAQKDRAAGCNQMKTRLTLDRLGQARMRIFKDRCPKLVTALSKIMSGAPEKPDEYEMKSEYAHACDSLRFLCMDFPMQKVDRPDPRDAEVAKWDRLFAAQPKTTNPDHGSMSSGYGDA